MASARCSLLAALLALVVASCGKVAVDDTGAPADDGEDTCGERPFPAAFKGCIDSSDCTIAFRRLNCCGSVQAAGVNGGSTTALRVFDERCNPQHPTCDCDPGPALVEDGSTTDDAEALYVRCDQGRCMTFVKD